MKNLLILVAFALSAGALQAQQVLTTQPLGYWEDVIQFSDQTGGGTARMQAIQNAQVGLGGDISNAATNPAGLGLMKRSEFSATLSLLNTNTLNTQPGTSTTGQGANFHYGTLGYASSKPVSSVQTGLFRGGTFAMTLTRLNHFNNYRTYNTTLRYNGTPNSYVDQYLQGGGALVQESLGNTADPNALTRFVIQSNLTSGDLTQNDYETRYAYSRYLIDTVNVNDTVKFYSRIPVGDVNQRGRILDQGSQNQVDIAYGFNLGDKIYLGGGIGIPYLNHRREILYTETLTSVANPADAQQAQYQGFSFDRRETYTWSGVGFNAKLGAIYQPNKHIRLGVSAQTASWYSIRNDYTFTVDPRFINSNGQKINYDTIGTPTAPEYDNPEFDANNQQVVYRIVRTTYRMRTPGQFSAGLTLLDEKLGFISVQATLQPYSMARLRGNEFTADNTYLQSVTRLTKQVRVGAEFLAGPLFRIRAGAAWLENPVTTARDTWSYSFGGGARFKKWYVDVAANVFQRRQQYTIYRYAPTINTLANNVLTQVTLGANF